MGMNTTIYFLLAISALYALCYIVQFFCGLAEGKTATESAKAAVLGAISKKFQR